jgi:adenylate cyclase
MASKARLAPVVQRFSWIRLVVALSSLAVIAGLLFAPGFAPWVLRYEHWTADWRTAYLSDRAVAPNARIAVVTIDDETLKDLPSSPIDRGLLADLVAGIKEAGARAIGLDILFYKPTDDRKDARLVDALKAAPVILGATDERGKSELKPFQWDFQTTFLDKVGQPAGYLNLRYESDGVVRYAARPLPGSRYPKSFARLLAEAGGKDATDTGDPIPWIRDPGDGTPAFLTIPAQDVLAKSGSAISNLRDRIVLVGGDFQNRDRHRVPLSVRDGEDMTGLMIHARILAGMLDRGSAVAELTPEVARWLLIGIGSIGFCLGWLLWQSNVLSLLRWTLATLLLLAIDALCFRVFHLLMPFTLALLMWFASVTAGRALHVLASSTAWFKTSPA